MEIRERLLRVSRAVSTVTEKRGSLINIRHEIVLCLYSRWKTRVAEKNIKSTFDTIKTVMFNLKESGFLSLLSPMVLLGQVPSPPGPQSLASPVTCGFVGSGRSSSSGSRSSSGGCGSGGAAAHHAGDGAAGDVAHGRADGHPAGCGRHLGHHGGLGRGCGDHGAGSRSYRCWRVGCRGCSRRGRGGGGSPGRGG